MGLPVEVNSLMMGSLGGYNINRSLRFRSSASAYLNRTPATASNRKTWTWSGWLKRGTLSSASGYNIFLAQSGTTFTYISFNPQDQLEIGSNTSGTANHLEKSAAVYRDPSAWYHIVLAVDTTQATASNRIKLYVNGSQVTTTITTQIAQNTDTHINSTIFHSVGSNATPASFYDGYLAEVNFIDGQALTPSSFGAYDTNGIWQPKKYTGTYGTNGFYLPFSSGFNTTQTYAGSFNGSSQFLSVASSASLSPGTGDFTVEANIYFNALPSASGFQGIFENQIATTAAISDKFWCGLYNSAGTYQLGIGQHNTANRAYAVWTPTVGTWYHVALVRQSGTTLVFVNGVQQTVTNSTVLNGANFSQNGASFGAASNTGAPAYFNGYISNARYVVGSAVYTTGFTPPLANLTAVTNTQWLTLQNSTIIDNSTAARTITNNGSLSVSLQYPFQYTLSSVGSDYSGNSNNWTLNNINYTILGTTYDSMIDSPTVSETASNYAVLNPLGLNGFVGTMSNANLTWTSASSGAGFAAASTIPAKTGGTSKWYCEITMGARSSTYHTVGLSTTTNGWTSPVYIVYRSDGLVTNNGTTVGTFATFNNGDVIGMAFDNSNGNISFYKNNVLQATTTASLSYNWYFVVAGDSTAGTATFNANFGQRPFSYTPPTGFNALNTYNLPAPSISNGAQYMAATTYTGNGSTQTITNSGNNTIGTTFQPDLIWMKSRNNTYGNILFDSVRGGTKRLVSNLTDAEQTVTGGVNSFNTDGMTIQNDATYANINASSTTYIGWQWKAGGTGVTNNSGTITSTVSANPTAGFSVVTYTGNGTAGATVGHGLGVAPAFYITKSRSSYTNSNWCVYHQSQGATKYAILNQTDAFGTTSTIWNNTEPTSTVFSLGSSVQTNNSGLGFVAYCFAAVSGYSSMGSYTGNGSTDGPFIFTGFKPRFVMVKSYSGGTGDWEIRDTSRDSYNSSISARLFGNSSAAEDTSGFGIDILSNGFKCRSTGTNSNGSGYSYIYAAFAESPFKISRAR